MFLCSYSTLIDNYRICERITSGECIEICRHVHAYTLKSPFNFLYFNKISQFLGLLS